MMRITTSFTTYLIALLLIFNHCVINVLSEEKEGLDSTATCHSGNHDAACLSFESNNDLYDDTSDMLKVAMHTYGYSCMRKLITNFQQENFINVSLINNENMMAVDFTNIVSFANDNKDILLELNKTNSEEFSMECSGSLLNLWNGNNNDNRWREKEEVTVAIDTDNSGKSLVYGIVVDHRKKRIIVSFRGSETIEDWTTNLKVFYKEVSNPYFSKNANKQPKKIRFHTGFYDYLMKKPWRIPFFGKDLGIKYDIIKEELTKVLKANVGYNLFVTGHSLGGSLSTLFSFYISSEMNLNIPKPVTLITFASPLIGDEQWQTAYQHLEKDDIVRHLRVTVMEDYVPTVPISSPINWSREYKHTGINLKLRDHNQPPELKHSYGMMTRAKDETKWFNETLPWHTLTMYLYRLEQVKGELQKKYGTLEQLYDDLGVLGDFLKFE